MANRMLDEPKAAVGNGSRCQGPDDDGALAQVADRARHWAHDVERFIVENPVVSLSIALSVGILLGWWVKRR